MLSCIRPSLLAALAGAAIPLSASAQTISWAAAVDGAWNDITKWSPQSVPDTLSESAVLGLTGPYTVSLSGVTGYSILGLRVNNPQAVLVMDAWTGVSTAQLSLGAGGLVNDGLIRLTANPATHNNIRLGLAPGDLAITGTGEVRLEEADDTEIWCSAATGSFTNNAPHRITGTGSIESGGATFINSGTVLADRAGGLELRCPVSNAATIRAVAPGSMTLSDAMTQSHAGVVEADATTFTLASGAVLSGGTGRSMNGGAITVAAGTSTANNVIVEGEWRVPALTTISTTTLQSTSTGLINNGLIRLLASDITANNCRLLLNGDGLALTGAGEVRMEEAGDAYIVCSGTSGRTFSQGPDHLISGAGTITSSGATFINHGLIRGDVAGGLTLECPVTNNAAIRAVPPGEITLNNTTNQESGAYFEADGATITFAAGAVANGGVGRSLNGGVITVAPGTATANGVTVEGEWQVPAHAAISTTTLQVATAGLINNGLIRLPANDATANNARIYIAGDDLRITGTGEIRLEEAGDAFMTFAGTAGQQFGQEAGHTLSGAGTITSSGGKFVNNGLIRADLAGGLLIASPISNCGAIRAIWPGAITLDNTMTQACAGYFEADGTTFTLESGAVVYNGVGRTVNGGVVTVAPGTAIIESVTVQGEWQVPAYAAITTTTLQTTTGFFNDGLIRLPANAGTHNHARLYLAGETLSLMGTGEVILEEPDDTFITGPSSGTFGNGPGHRLGGVGRITSGGARFENEGILAPGAPRGSLRIECPTTLKASGTLEIELSGDVDSQRDVLDATGRALTLGGTLNLHTHDGYSIPACSSIIVVRGNITGTFDAYDLPVMPDAELAVTYGPTTVTVTYIPGDLNGDGLLDFADYLVFLNLYDAQDPRADLNQDGLVDFSDYLEFLNRYDAGC